MDEPAVYLDNAATTRVDEAVAQAMLRAMTVDYGNPSSAHRLGLEASRLLDRAREQVARALRAEARDVYFTSGGTEANAIGVLGAMERNRGRHVVCSAIEHPSVMDATRRLAERGLELAVVPCERDGVVAPEALARAVRPDTAVVTLMLVNNELGTVQPVWEAARLAKQISPRCHFHSHFHIDAVQALGKVAIDVGAGPIDSLAVSAHKIHGPKGAGALWLRRGAQVASITVGGGQEKGVRPGTQGVPGAVGLGAAAEAAEAARPEAIARLGELRDRFLAGARALFPRLRPTVPSTDPARVLPHILSLGFPGVPAEPLLHALEGRGVYVSAGSACASREKRPSAVLQAVGVPDDVGVLRFSFARHTTLAEVDRALAALGASLRELA
jgi:cysteine desulfurase